MPGGNLLRQVTYRSALYHRGQWTWREKGQPCCYPTAWHGYKSLVSSSFMELLALSPLLRSPPMRAVPWASTSHSFLSGSGDCVAGKPMLPRIHTRGVQLPVNVTQEPHSRRGRGTHPCCSPPGPQNDESLEESREVVQGDCLSSHLHMLRIQQISLSLHLTLPEPYVWPALGVGEAFREVDLNFKMVDSE